MRSSSFAINPTHSRKTASLWVFCPGPHSKRGMQPEWAALLRDPESDRVLVEGNDPHSNGSENGLSTITGIELLVDRCQVILDRLLTDVHLVGNLRG
jgi:hypothetical protein